MLGVGTRKDLPFVELTTSELGVVLFLKANVAAFSDVTVLILDGGTEYVWCVVCLVGPP